MAALRPRPDAPAIMRKLPSASVESPTLVAITSSTQAASPRLVEVPANGAPLSLASVRPRSEPAAVVPLAPERYRIQLTVSRETHDKFRRAQSLLRHAVPSGDAAEIFDRAITLLVGSLERQRFAETSRPRAARVSNASPQRSRHISASVRRAVWHRDGGRCAFIRAAGRCREMALLEFHHVEPYAVGGVASLDNLELRCRAHNAYEARLYFGDGVVRECGTRSFGSTGACRGGIEVEQPDGCRASIPIRRPSSPWWNRVQLPANTVWNRRHQLADFVSNERQ